MELIPQNINFKDFFTDFAFQMKQNVLKTCLEKILILPSVGLMALDERYHVEWKNISRYIRELFNYHCACCGKYCNTPTCQQDLLQVHHIDENPENNCFENLIPLCAVCHLRIEKEARLHAPFENIQNELFAETYMTAMQTMREEGLKQYGGFHQQPTAGMSAEEFELEEIERDLDY